LYLILTGRLSIVLRPRLLVGGALILLVTTALWYAPMLWRHGREFIDEFFIAHHFQRYTSNKYKHPQPFYFFFLVVLAGCFPWTSFLLASLGQTWRERYKLFAETQRLRLFLWLWVLAPLIFFSLSGSKLPGYILPVFPALALLIGEQLTQLGEPGQAAKPRWPQLGVTLLLLLGALLGGLSGLREFGLNGRQLVIMAGPVLLLALAHLALSLRSKLEQATRWLPFGLALLVVIAVHQIFPTLGEVESLATLSQQAQRAALPGERLLFYINSHHSVDFYAPELPLRDERSELVTAMSKREVVEQTTARSSLLVLSPKRWASDLTESSDLIVETLGQSATRQNCAPGCDWLLLRARPKNKP
jgi:4-amino-4-deoxy-L-arabinose transferase-like glycosyltransferase